MASTWNSPTADVAATGILTLTGNALDTETVVIDGKTYTFQAVLTDVDGNVLIGATASDSIDNLVAAITLGAGAGTTYAASTTLHPTVTAAAGAGDTMDATAKTAGSAGNSLTTTETLTNGSWGGATLSGGTDSGDYSDPLCWTPTGVPALAGDVIFDDTSIVSVTAGYAQGGVDLHTWFVAEGYTGDFGDANNSLVLSVSNGTDPLLTYAGQGKAYIKAGASNIDKVLVLNTSRESDYSGLVLDCEATQEITELIFARGRGKVVASAKVPTINVSYVSSKSSDADLQIEANATVTTLTTGGGKVDCKANLATLVPLDGETTIGGSATVGTIGTGAGKVIYNSSGTVTTINDIIGDLDFSGSPGCTITNRPTQLAGKFNIANERKTVVLSNDLEWVGGEFIWDKGMVVSLT